MARPTETAKLARRVRHPTVTVVAGRSDDVAGGAPVGIRSLELDLDQQFSGRNPIPIYWTFVPITYLNSKCLRNYTFGGYNLPKTTVV